MMKPIFICAIVFSLSTLFGHAALKVGSEIPDTLLKTSEGVDVTLHEVVNEKPTVLIFYRGSWCPYCMKHLKDLQDNYAAFLKKGFKIIAVSPDSPEKVLKMQERFEFPFLTLSDSPMDMSEDFGLAFEVDPDTRELYKRYGIDLEDASGQNHYLLPQPSVYIIDATMEIVFIHTNPDYKERMESDEILTAIFEHAE